MSNRCCFLVTIRDVRKVWWKTTRLGLLTWQLVFAVIFVSAFSGNLTFLEKFFSQKEQPTRQFCVVYGGAVRVWCCKLCMFVLCRSDQISWHGSFQDLFLLSVSCFASPFTFSFISLLLLSERLFFSTLFFWLGQTYYWLFCHFFVSVGCDIPV